MKLSIDNNLLSVDNYEQIIEINDDLIRLKMVSIKGYKLRIKFLDKYRIVVDGEVKEIKLGE